MAGALKIGVEATRLELEPDEDCWLPSLNAVRLPAGVDGGAVVEALLEEYGIESAGGLGHLSGQILQIGCTGHSAREENALALVSALGNTPEPLNADLDADTGASAARRTLRR